MTGPATSYIPDLLEEHYEELQFLWGRRQSALRSPSISVRHFSVLEERIEGHAQGLLVAQDRVIPLLEEGLAAADSAAVFAAAYPLLRLGTEPARSLVLTAFGTAAGKQLEGIRQALCQSPVSAILPALQALFFSSSPPRTATAAEVLAFHRVLPPQLGPIQQLLQDEDPSVRQSGWRVVATAALAIDPKLYAAAMRDDAAGVRRAAVEAAAWNGLPAALALGRQIAELPTPDNLDVLEVFGLLGTVDDLRYVQWIGKATEAGPGRFRVVGCFGHSALMELVLAELANADAATACAAGAAFTKMTDEDIDSRTRTKLPPEDGHEPDEFEAEFLEEVRLPDPELARSHWGKAKPRLAGATRICRGFDISHGVTAEALASFDMESRWEFFLRSRFMGTWTGSPASLEKFPQPR